jgi:hypothetical protein
MRGIAERAFLVMYRLATRDACSAARCVPAGCGVGNSRGVTDARGEAAATCRAACRTKHPAHPMPIAIARSGAGVHVRTTFGAGRHLRRGSARVGTFGAGLLTPPTPAGRRSPGRHAQSPSLKYQTLVRGRETRAQRRGRETRAQRRGRETRAQRRGRETRAQRSAAHNGAPRSARRRTRPANMRCDSRIGKLDWRSIGFGILSSKTGQTCKRWIGW